MAKSGIGSRFASVNLNESYGQHSHTPSGSHGSNRHRPGSHGGGGGMVVLSRPRSSQKTGSKLSVPPPLNLPSLRKEHEKFDLLGPGGAQGTGGSTGAGSRPTSSGLGWTKPIGLSLHDKDSVGGGMLNGKPGSDALGIESVSTGVSSSTVNGVGSGGSSYMPPSVRTGLSSSLPVEKAVVLSGEDFPSLKASIPAASVAKLKLKDSVQQKQKHGVVEKLPNEKTGNVQLSSPGHMRSHVQSTQSSVCSGVNEKVDGKHGLSSHHAMEKTRNQAYFPGPLPLVHFNPRSDWADDERDTSHGLADKGKDHANTRGEAYWDKDLDIPRENFLPHKSTQDVFSRRGHRDVESGNASLIEVPKNYASEVRNSSRGGNSWRSSHFQKGGSILEEMADNKTGSYTRTSISLKAGKDNKPIPDGPCDNSSSLAGNWDSAFGRRDVGNGHGGRQQWNQKAESPNSWAGERNKRFSNQNTRHNGDVSSSLGINALSLNDPILNVAKKKYPFSKSEKPYQEDPYLKEFSDADFDGRDPFATGLVGMVKKKKDVPKQADFHDPIRESFEAELERVQKIQEQERQRIIEEQERAIELARREEEERMRLAREWEERQRRMEEEVREAAWREEQERLEASQRAEEQRIAREEEKRRSVMEEERRKQAAKQKLLELEAKIAQRQIDEEKSDNLSHDAADENASVLAKEKGILRVTDMGHWEDGERMVERITTSASSDSSSICRPSVVGSRPSIDASNTHPDRKNAANLWRGDVFENGNNLFLQDHETGFHSSRQMNSFVGRAISRKEVDCGGEIMSSRLYKGEIPDSHVDDFSCLAEQRWQLSVDGEQYHKNSQNDPGFHQNFGEKSGDGGWVHSHSHDSSFSSYAEERYRNPEAVAPYSYSRSRYSLRQPRVLPPPSLSSMHEMPSRVENQHPGSSTLADGELKYNYAQINEPSRQLDFSSGRHEPHEFPDMVDAQHNNQGVSYKLNRNMTPGCDSQSSLSVSSPPNSPPHLSHDDLDESGDSPMLSAATKVKNDSAEGSQTVSLIAESAIGNQIIASGSISTADVEEWTVHNNEQLQEQEEYEEDEGGYHEEDEVHEGDEENIDLTQELEDLHLERGSDTMTDNMVLGFDEGVEVGLPSVEFEGCLRKEDSIFVSTVEVERPFDGVDTGGKVLESVDSTAIDGSSKRVQETEKSVDVVVTKSPNSPQSSTTSDILHTVDVPCSVRSTQPSFPSSDMDLHSLSDPTVVPPSSSQGQADLPVKLQFGLFSGPSLIPSPVPSIQIGSIQMPLHLHPQVGPSFSHIHPSQQPPVFQFGQLRYSSPISQGIMSLTHQSLPYVHPDGSSLVTLNHNPVASLPYQSGQDTSSPDLTKGNTFPSKNAVPGCSDLSHQKASEEKSALPAKISREDAVMIQQSKSEISQIGRHSARSEPGYQLKNKGHSDRVRDVSMPYKNNSDGHLRAAPSSSMPMAGERDLAGSKAQRVTFGSNTRKLYNVRNSGSMSSFMSPELSRTGPRRFQKRHRRNILRTEFRIRENPDGRQSSGLAASNPIGMIDKSDLSERVPEISLRSGSKRGSMLNKPRKQASESDYLSTGLSSLQENEPGSRVAKEFGKGTLKGQNSSHPGERKLKRDVSSGDVDAPLQTGIVRIFEQPGIEVPSDVDDFIEVRSKRQMLNDRRERMEKEIKAKSRAPKMPQKTRSTLQTAVVSTSLGREVAKAVHSDFFRKESQSLADTKVSAGFNNAIVSQPLAPIGTPPVNNLDSHADMRSQTSKPPLTSGVSGFGPSLTKVDFRDTIQTSLASWVNAPTTQQVIPLTQSQLDEAMKPAPFETCAVSIGDHCVPVGDPSMMSSSSILTKDKSFSSSACPINSLLAGEKIQFGAVTSPTVLPPSSRVVLHAVGPPISSQPNIQITPHPDSNLFDESRPHLEDSEAEAEAAASAVAVAAISNDEPATVSKSFSGADVDGVATASVAGDPQLSTHSRAEESLCVALPADLSIEPPGISLWPPLLQSPQNSSSQMLSRFPGGSPSPFPFYDMNPLFGGPMYAFGSHDESLGAQSQPLKSGTSSSGAWKHHAGVDPFYGPPAGFTGPFISPPGGIPGVQGPPHMVVYNHFAPVGQYGQVGLSFMGTTYIPSGKQADWKHDSTATATVPDLSTLSMGSPARPLAPGSSLLPLPSPLPMCDVSPFQSSPDMPVQARCPRLPALLLSLPQQPQPPFSHPPPPPAGQPFSAGRFSESLSSTPSDAHRSFPVATEVTPITQFPDEPAAATTKCSPGSSEADGGKAMPRNDDFGGVRCQTRSPGFRAARPAQQKNVAAPAGYSNYQRGGGGVLQKGSGGEWPYRRVGFQGRSQVAGVEKSLPAAARLKQIYVAKQTSGGATSSLA